MKPFIVLLVFLGFVFSVMAECEGSGCTEQITELYIDFYSILFFVVAAGIVLLIRYLRGKKNVKTSKAL